ncbi:His Kinase A (phospho-acceptor) domain/Cache domain [Gulbenkiania indica]|uniref:histidine kinase n=1 Tax=Gulbenkiania indica TaxID=375574 RepID=A0A0K6GV34_9NEIS|nr:histidine kinase dimerization/phospho-acceptor domain-containing protein [Gulbenkiania indica]CUA82572.1 His Kinase A (phospho-acceptor) domain/Cache domain [Gulbenkiania indica]
MNETGQTRSVPLERWLWRSFLRAAIVPLLVIELGFLMVYWISGEMTLAQNRASVTGLTRNFFERAARQEGTAISQQLMSVETLTRLFARQTGSALATPAQPDPTEVARYTTSPEGAFYTTRDNGGAAAFFSGHVPVGPAEKDKVWRTVRLDPLMKDIVSANPLVTQVYFNTRDSYNRIYPYFEVLSQYPVKMDIPSYNFYYEADGKHNPLRRAVWTDAYLDPAGSGWMVSSIAPVWLGDRLEAVVGIDVTLKTVVDQVLKLDLPGSAYAMLLSRDGTILALPSKGEGDWRLRELTRFHYTEAITSNTFKPESFRIDRLPAGKRLADAMRRAPAGTLALTLDQPVLASWARVAGPGWTLVLVAPENEVLAEVNSLHGRLAKIGYGMVLTLLAFYVVFFAVLYRHARRTSRRMAGPMAQFESMVGGIGKGRYPEAAPDSDIEEMNRLGTHIVGLGQTLKEAARQLETRREQDLALLERERALNREHQRFIETMSHEVRTPLTLIDSTAQSLERRADQMPPQTVVERAVRIRAATQRLAAMLDETLAEFPVDSSPQPVVRMVRSALARLPDGLITDAVHDAAEEGRVAEAAWRCIIDEVASRIAHWQGTWHSRLNEEAGTCCWMLQQVRPGSIGPVQLDMLTAEAEAAGGGLDYEEEADGRRQLVLRIPLVQKEAP